jgi:Tol biopolymer transport system component
MKLPVSMGQYYGYATQTGRILMAQVFADHGAGPGNAAVSDLSILDLQSGQVRQILSDNVVEAAWGPDGESFAYVLARPSTYELRWRSAEGQDSLLAKDVSFTWSLAPSGEAIAFTRESGYNLSAAPGLFVVTVPNAEEIHLSDADKGGAGSISDRPVWSPDSQEVIFSLWGGAETRLILARADGSQVFDLGVDPSAADVWWSGLQIPDLLWYPDGDQVLVSSSATNPDNGAGGMGGTTALVAYRLDRANHRLAEGRLVGDSMGLIDWDVPGKSIWSIGPGGLPDSVTVSAAP